MLVCAVLFTISINRWTCIMYYIHVSVEARRLVQWIVQAIKQVSGLIFNSPSRPMAPGRFRVVVLSVSFLFDLGFFV